MASATPFEQIGGEETLRGLISRFVDRFFEDRIIGFLFTGKDRDRIKQHEYEHAAAVLGHKLPYTGRPLIPLHRSMKINAGQFRRRLAIMRQEIRAAGIPPELENHWLDREATLEGIFTDGTDCV